MLKLLVAAQAILAVLLIVAFVYQSKQTRRLRGRFEQALGQPASNTDLETTLVTYFDALNTTKEQLDQMHAQFEHLSAIGANSLQKVGLIRFIPCRDTGRDQSFALCLLDGNNSGLILTAVHGREGTRIYAKSIEYGHSQGALSAEEKRAFSEAKRSHKA